MGPEQPQPQDLGVAELEVDSLAIGGRGVARHAGVVWLIDGALPGDRIEALAVRTHPRWVEARTVRVLRSSADRRVAPCAIQPICGGCAWMGLAEELQRSWKQRLVADALERIGGIVAPPVESTLPSPEPFGYRNKIELTFGADAAGGMLLGYHRVGSASDLVDVERCAVADEVANRVVAIARKFFAQQRPARVAGARLVIRSSRRTGQALIAFRSPPGPLPDLSAFAQLVRAHVPEVVSVVRIETQAGRRGGARTVAVSGRPWMEESLAGLAFRLPAAAFCQINPAVAERLVALVEELAEVAKGSRVLELYGGVGLLSLALARQGASALVCDADAEALTSGRHAAREAGLPVRYVRADVGRFFQRGEHEISDAPEVVLADPPRAGLGRAVAGSIADLGARRIVLISCDPATLARDVREIVGHGYRLARAIPLDMFPQTPHIETVALLLRDQ